MVGNVTFAPSAVSPPARTSPAAPPRQTDPATQAAITQLAAEDRHVRAHEMAHLIAAGPYARGGPSYSYTVGPDGRLYAVAGDVSLDTSPDPAGPEATIRKAQIIEAAANAPVDPSSQDRAVAADAAQMEASAEAQLAAQQRYVRSAYQPPDQSASAQLMNALL